MMIAVPIPKVSSMGNGPISRKNFFSNPNSVAIQTPHLHSARVIWTVLGSEAQNGSRFARLMHFNIRMSWARFP